MWRCKWVELQIKKFEAQAQEYDRKLDEYSQRKQNQLEKHPLEGLGVKSLPHCQNDATTEVLRRKKRTRAEATKDVTAYMLHHNLFSYYENRKHFTEGAIMHNELKNPAKGTQKVNTNDEFLGDDKMVCDETGNDDNSLEHIFRKIEFLQSQVGKLKSRVDKGDDDVLIDNWRMNEEMNSFEEVKIQPTQRPLVLKDVFGSTSPPVPAEADLPMDDQTPPKTRSISKLIGPQARLRGGDNSVGW
ncbi:UNVERIFIED_CONTAM: hypothetical protein Scaly_2621000 [Sesamum calycinum]|uniref:Uncharacterized protein n=1 Tax=Sesamum calycinum TaxID=2727403 RepID=A0AAW2JBN4_9LAMI